MKKLILLLIKCYIKFISPMKRKCCKFIPTCSVYVYQAVERFGVVNGCFLAIKRILKCNPFSSAEGFDPVPQKKKNIEDL